MTKIVRFGEPVLKQHAAAVALEEIQSPEIQKIITDMKETLRPEKLGVAIAAPQIGESVRIFVISGKTKAARTKPREEYDPEQHPDDVYINPEIVRMSKKTRPMHEGCLSLPGKWGHVARVDKLTVRAYDESGALFTKNTSGLIAHIIQHEIDHLNGVLYTDKAIDVYDDDEDEQSEAI